ncbi:SRPBCC domain-containing protein [Pontibacter chitinilyticus]|uniref:SRPBCC domain-containing protein n=1 Tax=Pontibacter chitinilyticus TaxID=2674989 RepID=UPI00321BF28B
MKTEEITAITVETTLAAPVAQVWSLWTEARHIKKWYYASDDWYAPDAVNDLQVTGTFSTTMAAKDGSMAFEFEGVYTRIVPLKAIDYTLNDGRKVSVIFTSKGNETTVTEVFEPETSHPLDLQKNGWQAILDNFRKYVETQS